MQYFVSKTNSMKSTFLFCICVLLFIGCKKQEQATPVIKQSGSGGDFALVPTKDAKWYVHMVVGEGCFPNDDPADFDISGITDYLDNCYYVIEALGRDTVCNNKTYHIYKIDLRQKTAAINPPQTEYHRSYLYYLREDTLTKKVYQGYLDDQSNEANLVVDFSDNANKPQVVPFPTWREVDIIKTPDMIVGGKVLKTWSMQNIEDGKLQHFYKAQGIGTSIGILPQYTGGYLWQTVSLDFVYKGDSVHFEYPYQ